MSEIDADAALTAALGTVDGVRVADLGRELLPPAVIVGPAELTWGAHASEPTEATFQVALVVAADERAKQRLYALRPLVTAAIETVIDAVVTTARPGTWTAGGQELPAYLIDVEMSI